ncbi:MAG: hypothetical protein AAFU64_13825 [Bacteroidota bacterium]
MHEQLALISAILGGFAFTFLATILSMSQKAKIIDFTFIISVISSILFFISALGWSLMAMSVKVAQDPVKLAFADKHRLLSLLFIAGVFSLVSSLGLSGWIRSRRMGIITTFVALLGLITIFYILRDFIN